MGGRKAPEERLFLHAELRLEFSMLWFVECGLMLDLTGWSVPDGLTPFLHDREN